MDDLLQRIKKMIAFDKKTASTFAIHFGLIIGVVVYTLFGAFTMQVLESPERVKASIIKREAPTEKVVKVYLGTEVAAVDPGVHACLRFVLANVMNSTKCDQHELEHLNIGSIDSCYQFANFKKLEGNLNTVTIPATTTPVPVTDLPEDEEVKEDKWSFGNALIFAFTVITTIGYGHVAPETFYGRLFCILYGLIGVPLTLLTIADLGMFISLCLKKLIAFIEKCVSFLKKLFGPKRKPPPAVVVIDSAENDKKSILETAREASDLKDEEDGEEEQQQEEGGRKTSESIALCTTFALYLFFGAKVLSVYEPEMDFFKALYFNFVTLTTIGLGDFVPKSFDYLFITLCYIGVGLALTTMAIEIAADLLKKVHYAGRKMENVANAVVWFGGKKMTMKALVKNLGDKFNIPPEDLANFDFDQFADNAMKVQAGEIKTLRKDEPKLSHRAVSYTNIRRRSDDHSIGFMDENRFSRSTVDPDTFMGDTFRTVDTLPIFYENSSIDGRSSGIPRLNLDTPELSDSSALSSFDKTYLKTIPSNQRF